MKLETAKYWAASILGDAIFFGSFYFWWIAGSEGAGNIFVFYAWFVGVVSLLGGLSADRTTFKLKRPEGFAPYNYITHIAAISCIAFVGMFWCAAIYTIGAYMIEAAINREPRKAAA